MDKLMEIEKIKQLLMTPNQRILFDYQPKPVISVDSLTKLRRSRHTHDRMKVQKVDKL